MEQRYNNYHKHTHYSNLRTLDCIVKPIDYINRAKELGHNTYFTTEHGWGGNVWEAYTLCKENNLKMIFGVEAYYVDNRFEKDRGNYHIVLVAKNRDGYIDINSIISEANKTGFYYKPRIDKDLLLSINPDNVYITTACVAARLFKTEDYINEFLIPLHNHFQNHLFLEVQNHNEDIQKEFNKKILLLHNKYSIPLIHGNDSHYIHHADSKYRNMFLQAKGIYYADEGNFILDYPSYNEIINKYKIQNILSDSEAKEALDNTLIFDECEDLNFDKEIKMPIIHKNKDTKELLKQLILKQWNIEKQSIPVSQHNKYKQAIKEEFEIITKTNMQDYFLLDYEIIQKAKSKPNFVLSKTGRGCFTEDALVHTKESLKSIKDIEVGDYVVTKDGKFNKVLNTMSYDIEEEMVQINHLYGTNKYYPTVCTLDHKIYVKRNNELLWIQAKDLITSDYVCVPKIKTYDNSNDIIDLNKYNTFGYDYDDEYIYEITTIGKEYPYSTSDVANKINVSESLMQDFARKNCTKKAFAHRKDKLQELMEYIPFKTREEYSDYINNKKIKKIHRFIHKDKIFNIFIGLLYGDGFTIRKSKNGKLSGVGLAINNSTIKDSYNRMIFNEIAQRLNLDVSENESKTKKLSQLYMYSKVLANFVKEELFCSKKGVDKQFNSQLFNQSKENLLGIIEGLRMSDGSYNERRISFDNTSKSLINAYKLLCLMTGEGVNSLSVRKPWKTKEGYMCKQSYKLRLNKNSNNIQKKQLRTYEDNEYYYLPITNITILPKQKNRVYDITVENESNYLLNNMIVHNSAPSFIINKLLKFTDIDRVSAPVPLYPTRFMSATRILQTKSLPDIDLNFGYVEPVIEASEEILGEDGVYYMIAYKPLQDSSAFRLWCKAKGLDIKEYNDIAKNLDDYLEDDYWKDIIEESKIFRGVVESVSPSPSSYLLYDKPISKEVGLIKVGDVMCCCLDGYNCDVYKYLKNDYLIVKVWRIIAEVYKLINQPIDTIKELELKLDDKTWSMYELGLTATLNQADSKYATPLIKKYAPKSIAEMSAWVAGIRPGFASLMNNFLNRLPYTTNVDELDEILADSYHYMMYQESIMKYLIWLGIPEDETYGIIKKISKKKFKEEELVELKERLLEGWIKETNTDKGFEETWQVMNDASRYSFNASHSLCVGLDSIYGAYLKSHYPLEYYTVVLNMYNDDVEETDKITSELDYFNINIKMPRFRHSKANYIMDKETNSIYKGISSIKYLNETCANQLYELRNNKYDSFIELLLDIKNHVDINTRQMEILIKLDFFSEFGKTKKLFDTYNFFVNLIDKKQINKNKLESLNLTYDIIHKYSHKETDKTFKDIDILSMLIDIENHLDDIEITLKDKVTSEIEYLGYPMTKVDSEDLYYVIAIKEYKNKKSITRYLDMYDLNKGTIIKYRLSDYLLFAENPIQEKDIIHILSESKKAKKYLDESGKWQTREGEFNNCLDAWEIY